MNQLAAARLPGSGVSEPAPGDTRPGASIRGSLDGVAVLSLLRSLASLNRTGRLVVGSAGEVLFERGRIVAATRGPERGLAALARLCLEPASGRFVYADQPWPVVADPDLDGADALAQLEVLTAAGPGPTAVARPPAAAPADGDRVQLDRVALAILIETREGRSVAELAARHGLQRSLRALAALRGLDLIELETPAPAAPPATPAQPTDPSAAPAQLRTHAWPTVSPRLLWVLVVMASLTVLTRGLVQTYHIEGSSMQPTFVNGQRLVIERLAYLSARPRRGEVVVFHAPTSPDEDFIKRVIGLPGDRVLVKNGQVYVNGRRLDEPYVQNVAHYTYPADGQERSVPPDAYFVLGDNRPDSFDSHAGWFVRADQLVGRAAVSIWPPSTWGPVPQPAVVSVPVEEQVPSQAPALPVPSPIAPPTGPRTVLDERFSAMSPAWPNDPGLAWFADPGYQLAARRPGEFVAISAPVTDRLADVVVSGTFRKVGGPLGGGYGLIVRSQEPSTLDGRRQVGNYYVAEVGDRGEVGIWRRDGDHWVDLQPWTPSAAVRPGDGINELTLSARGTQLEFSVNGISVASVAGATLPAGGVGVFVGGDLDQVLLEHLLVQTAP